MNKPMSTNGIRKIIFFLDPRFDLSCLFTESGDLQLVLAYALTASTSTSQSGHPKQ